MTSGLTELIRLLKPLAVNMVIVVEEFAASIHLLMNGINRSVNLIDHRFCSSHSTGLSFVNRLNVVQCRRYKDGAQQGRTCRQKMHLIIKLLVGSRFVVVSV